MIRPQKGQAVIWMDPQTGQIDYYTLTEEITESPFVFGRSLSEERLVKLSVEHIQRSEHFIVKPQDSVSPLSPTRSCAHTHTRTKHDQIANENRPKHPINSRTIPSNHQPTRINRESKEKTLFLLLPPEKGKGKRKGKGKKQRKKQRKRWKKKRVIAIGESLTGSIHIYQREVTLVEYILFFLFFGEADSLNQSVWCVGY